MSKVIREEAQAFGGRLGLEPLVDASLPFAGPRPDNPPPAEGEGP